jgi:hypothetical protein
VKSLRPQILVCIIILGAIAIFSLELEHTAITTGCITLLGALGMKILESEK